MVSVLIGAFYVGSMLPTPLYPAYARAFGFSEITVTLIYAAYVIGNVTALLIFGKVSDQAGRRRISIPALAVAALSAACFLLAASTAWLFAARILSGLAVGVGASTATAWIAELYPGADKATPTQLAVIANLLGLAAGSLSAGLLASFAPLPLRLSFFAYLVVLALMALALAGSPETVAPTRPLGEWSFAPRIGVPRNIRIDFAAPALCAFATFALLGFYAALVPGLLARSLRLTSPVAAGAIVAGLFAISASTAALTPTLGSRTAMRIGLGLLPICVALLAVGSVMKSLPVLLAATALSGIASSLGFRGSLQVINQIAPRDQRAELISSYLLACYTGNSLPVIGVAVLSSLSNHMIAEVSFAVIITILALASLVIGVRGQGQS